MKKTINRTNIICALIINIAIVVLEIIGVFLSVQRHGIKVFQFYTENSNYFALIVSFIFCISCVVALIKRKHIPRWILNLRFVSTVCLTVTFVVVIAVLIPMFPDTFVFMMFQNSNLFQHFLCPVLSFISFIFFENQISLTKKSILYCLIPTLIYGVVLITLNLFKIITGPYPFFYVYVIPWYTTTLSLLGIFIGSLLITIILYYLHNKNNLKNNYKTEKILQKNA